MPFILIWLVARLITARQPHYKVATQQSPSLIFRWIIVGLFVLHWYWLSSACLLSYGKNFPAVYHLKDGSSKSNQKLEHVSNVINITHTAVPYQRCSEYIWLRNSCCNHKNNAFSYNLFIYFFIYLLIVQFQQRTSRQLQETYMHVHVLGWLR